MQVSLQALRVNNGYKTKELANKLGISTQTLYNWETHPERVSFGNILRLCKLYQVSPADIKI